MDELAFKELIMRIPFVFNVKLQSRVIEIWNWSISTIVFHRLVHYGASTNKYL